MTPSAALYDPVFRFYFFLAVGLLVAAGLALCILRFALRRKEDHAWKSYLGWLIMAPLVLLALFLGRIPCIVFFVALGGLGLHEFARATGLTKDWPLYIAAQLAVAAVGAVCLVTDSYYKVAGWYGLFIALPAFVIPAILIVPIARNRSDGQLRLVGLAMIGFLYFGWMFGHLAFLANAKHAYAYLLYLLVAVELSDVAAFTFGKLFGRHQMRSNISPKKTWEGAAGALLVSLGLPWALKFTMPHLSAWVLVLIGAIVGIGGQLGDLAISVIKRDLGIKDMGTLIPGHGGVLDRIDSLIFVAPLFFHTIRWFYDLY